MQMRTFRCRCARLDLYMAKSKKVVKLLILAQTAIHQTNVWKGVRGRVSSVIGLTCTGKRVCVRLMHVFRSQFWNDKLKIVHAF